MPDEKLSWECDEDGDWLLCGREATGGRWVYRLQSCITGPERTPEEIADLKRRQEDDLLGDLKADVAALEALIAKREDGNA